MLKTKKISSFLLVLLVVMFGCYGSKSAHKRKEQRAAKKVKRKQKKVIFSDPSGGADAADFSQIIGETQHEADRLIEELLSSASSAVNEAAAESSPLQEAAASFVSSGIPVEALFQVASWTLSYFATDLVSSSLPGGASVRTLARFITPWATGYAFKKLTKGVRQKLEPIKVQVKEEDVDRMMDELKNPTGIAVDFLLASVSSQAAGKLVQDQLLGHRSLAGHYVKKVAQKMTQWFTREAFAKLGERLGGMME